jgi:hypothetical protein
MAVVFSNQNGSLDRMIYAGEGSRKACTLQRHQRDGQEFLDLQLNTKERLQQEDRTDQNKGRRQMDFLKPSGDDVILVSTRTACIIALCGRHRRLQRAAP